MQPVLFDIIPKGTVGYTDADRAVAECWYDATYDGKNIYYVAFKGSVTLQAADPPLPSVLVSMNAQTLQVNYNINMQSMNMNTSGNDMTTCRVSPHIVGDRLYVTNSMQSAIGPQLYCIDKNTGSLIWSIAYDPPVGAPTTVRQNYDQYRNSNLRLGDLNITSYHSHGVTHIVVGVSSIQNTNNNLGIKAGGFPVYTDQGKIVIVKDLGSTAQVVKSIPMVPKDFKAGDVLSNSDPEMNPFSPSGECVFSAISSTGTLSNLKYFNCCELPAFYCGCCDAAPIAWVLPGATTIEGQFPQAVWSLFSSVYQRQADDTWLCVSKESLLGAKGLVAQFIPCGTQVPSSGNQGIYFYKCATLGYQVQQEDLQGLNYYGNSTWGEKPLICGDKMYIGTGQTHAMPFLDLFNYTRLPMSFNKLRNDMVIAENNYKAGLITLEQFNLARIQYGASLTQDLSMVMSPRDKYNLVDAMVEIDLDTLRITDSVRTIFIDSYNFAVTPDASIMGASNVADSDVSTGVFRTPTGMTSMTKSGFNFSGTQGSTTLASYLGPINILGGANYRCARYKDSLIGVQANVPTRFGQTNPETMITESGEIIPADNSFLVRYSPITNKVHWRYVINKKTFAQVIVCDDKVYWQSTAGVLYVNSARTGELLWSYEYLMSGGIASPTITRDRIFWFPSYGAYGLGKYGQYGIVTPRV